MKKLKQILAYAFCWVILSGTKANAAFPIKQESNLVAQQSHTGSTLSSVSTMGQETNKMSETKMLKTTRKATAKAIPQGLYIVLAIFWMGWLAMGINDDFQGNDWLISLLLYIIFYIPGLIYTLVKMNKYYS